MSDRDTLPSDPAALREWVRKLRKLMVSWANATDYHQACLLMKDIRRMINADLGEK